MLIANRFDQQVSTTRGGVAKAYCSPVGTNANVQAEEDASKVVSSKHNGGQIEPNQLIRPMIDGQISLKNLLFSAFPLPLLLFGAFGPIMDPY